MLMSPTSQLILGAHILCGRVGRIQIFYDILPLKVGACLGARASTVSISAVMASPYEHRAYKTQANVVAKLF